MTARKKGTPLSVLILNESPEDASRILDELRGAGFEPFGEQVATEEHFRSELKPDLDIVIASRNLSRCDGLSALESLKTSGLDIPFMVVARSPGEETITHLINRGAANFVSMTQLNHLGPAVRQALEQTRLRRDTTTALRAFQESENRYKRLVESARDVVFHLDSEGRITLLNHAFTTITGWPVGDWIGRPFPPLVHQSDLALAREKFAMALQGVVGDLFELRLSRKDGGYVTGEFVITRHWEEGTPVSVLGIARDVTERKRLEAHISHTQKMESLGALAGGIAHDFNNLLGIITGYCELASDSLEADHPVRSYLEQIDAAGERASSLVKRILTFARKTPISLEPLQMNDAIADIIRMLSETLPKTIEIRQELDERLPLIQADASQINQVLMNLCLNARDAMSSEGTLSLATKSLSAGELPSLFPNPSDVFWIRVSVTDTGAGMSEKVLASIFEPFFTTKDRGRGSGLGLPVVHGIVKKHQGHIDVWSEPDNGTRVDLYFPATEATAVEEPPPEEREESDDGGGGRILVVEDEPNIQRMTALSLRHNGYRVTTASDGAEALSVYENMKDDIALVLLDLGLPKIDGIRVAEAIKSINPKARIILASGYLEDGQKQKLERAPIDDFLQKPYELKDMLRRIQAVIRQPATR